MRGVVIERSVPGAYAIGTLGNVLIATFDLVPNPDSVEDTASAGRKLLARHARGGYLHFANATVAQPPPNDPTRRAYITMMREFGPRLDAASVIVDGTGVTAAVVRSVITGLVLIGRPSFPVKVFDMTSTACAWLAHTLVFDEPTTATELSEALATLRAY
jgi:hypothetical protein